MARHGTPWRAFACAGRGVGLFGPVVLQVLELTSVDRLVSIHDSVEAAEEDLAATSGQP